MTSIRSTFDKVIFEPIYHTYTHKETKEQFISVSKKIGKFKPKFDEFGHIVAAVARKENKTVAEVKQEWKEKADISIVRGNNIHNFLEALINDFELPLEDNSEETLHNLAEALEVYNSFVTTLEGKLLTEVLVYDEELKLAGQSDLLEVLEDGSINLYDWKSNKSIELETKYNTKMLGALSHLDDCNYIHYTLQLNSYRMMLEKKGYKVNKLTLIHINNGFTLYEIPKCDEELELMYKLNSASTL